MRQPAAGEDELSLRIVRGLPDDFPGADHDDNVFFSSVSHRYFSMGQDRPISLSHSSLDLITANRTGCSFDGIMASYIPSTTFLSRFPLLIG
jgi:hypothetical protein